MRALFVSGTDTGVGKTTVAAGILAALTRRGHAVFGLKPVETGCDVDSSGDMVPKDALLLRQAAGLGQLPISAIAPYRYQTPVCPASAARLEGNPFSIDLVRTAMSQHKVDLLLVEGAGGLLCPYTDGLLAADLARELDLSLLVVGRASLGTINHTLLTLSEARHRGLDVVGVVLSRQMAQRGPDEEDNPGHIARLGNVRVLGVLPHLAESKRRDINALADAAENALNLDVLLAA